MPINWPHRLAVRTLASHAGNRSSILRGVTTKMLTLRGRFCFVNIFAYEHWSLHRTHQVAVMIEILIAPWFISRVNRHSPATLVWQLVMSSEASLLKVPGLGRKLLERITKALAKEKLSTSTSLVFVKDQLQGWYVGSYMVAAQQLPLCQEGAHRLVNMHGHSTQNAAALLGMSPSIVKDYAHSASVQEERFLGFY